MDCTCWWWWREGLFGLWPHQCSRSFRLSMELVDNRAVVGFGQNYSPGLRSFLVGWDGSNGGDGVDASDASHAGHISTRMTTTRGPRMNGAMPYTRRTCPKWSLVVPDLRTNERRNVTVCPLCVVICEQMWAYSLTTSIHSIRTLIWPNLLMHPQAYKSTIRAKESLMLICYQHLAQTII